MIPLPLTQKVVIAGGKHGTTESRSRPVTGGLATTTTAARPSDYIDPE
jgi:hypothetical protein